MKSSTQKRLILNLTAGLFGLLPLCGKAEAENLGNLSAKFNQAPGGSAGISIGTSKSSTEDEYEAPDSNSWLGKWERVNLGRAYSASLTISKIDHSDVNPKFDFKLDSMNGGNTGEIEGKGKILGSFAFVHIKDDDVDCEMVFAKQPNGIKVEHSFGCNFFGGLNVFFSGLFEPEGTKPLVETLSQRDIIEDRQEEAFKKLVGDRYDDFVSSMQIIYAAEDLDSLGASVRTGGVRGMYTISEAIVMRAPGDRFWAAVIDGESIRYFTNVTEWKKKLPKTIEEWRARMPDLTVSYAVGE